MGSGFPMLNREPPESTAFSGDAPRASPGIRVADHLQVRTAWGGEDRTNFTKEGTRHEKTEPSCRCRSCRCVAGGRSRTGTDSSTTARCDREEGRRGPEEHRGTGWHRDPRLGGRSEERRVGKECRSRWSPY